MMTHANDCKQIRERHLLLLLLLLMLLLQVPVAIAAVISNISQELSRGAGFYLLMQTNAMRRAGGASPADLGGWV